jgi:SAM-dependent methyltransferase
MSSAYVHGYDDREARRLVDQATTLVELLHADSAFPAGSVILEAGCGVGAQTVTLARLNPQSQIMSIDISLDSLQQAEAACAEAGVTNVSFEQGDIFDLRFADASFDQVFVCFVLEHLPDPIGAAAALRRVIRPGGTMTVVEGDHGSTFFHPDSDAARAAIDCQVQLQARIGGNANIGRQLYPLLVGAGFETVRVSPRHVYVDGSRPQWILGFTRNTFTAMIEGVRDATRRSQRSSSRRRPSIKGFGICTAAATTGLRPLLQATESTHTSLRSAETERDVRERAGLRRHWPASARTRP